ncbi:HIT domain-containing protein [Aurantivibrio infirmus]
MFPRDPQFVLDAKLEADTLILGRFELSLLLLHKDANYPWCILVPQRRSVKEIHHLGKEDRMQLMRESCHLAEVMADVFVPEKMNIAVLGNIVPQLHMHHVARFDTDPAWPGPVWGAVAASAYTKAAEKEIVQKLRSALKGDDFELET